ncbi:cadherin domain-containing protein [Microvirga zambiensis]|uniref:cadherin domain-containing protein n=1 Tax=Microvirga zambiensis TaxID=1402137 RepID=UPI00191FD457|nr:cadherin domain-containing protein [Microvirga zambiensis]
MAAPVLWGSEFLVNETTARSQLLPASAVLADGSIVVCFVDWSQAETSRSLDIRARIFNPDGTVKKSEFVVSSTSEGSQYEPDIVALSDGGFLIAWQDNGPPDPLIRVRAFDAMGNAPESDFVLGELTGSTLGYVSLAARADGGFTAAYGADDGRDYGVRFRSYARGDGGQWQAGDERAVSGTAGFDQLKPVVRTLTAQNDLLVYVDDGSQATDIRARIFARADGGVVKDITVAADVYQSGSPSATLLKDGRFVVTWMTGNLETHDLQGQIFDANGNPASAVLTLTTDVATAANPIVALDDGGFAIAFGHTLSGQDDPSDIHLATFDRDGVQQGSVGVTADPTAGQWDPSLSKLPDGRLVVSWTDYNPQGDSSETSVRARIVDPRQKAVNLTGTPFDDEYYGTGFDDTLAGAAGADELHGEDGNDTLNGGKGNDTLDGGDGDNDLAVFSGRRAQYQVTRNPDGTVTVEGPDGTDLVKNVRGLRFDDGAELLGANATPTGLALSSDLSLEENAPIGAVVGTLSATDADGDEVRYSLASGTSSPFAIRGNSLVVISTLDFETKPTHQLTIEAKDEFGASTSLTVTVSVTNAIETTPFTLQGTGGADTLIGEAGNDTVFGAAGNDLLSGEDGDDRLYGGLGKDQLKGGSGKDIFVFDTKPNKSTNVDRIEDFSVKDDSIFLDNKVFTKLGAGTFSKPKKFNSDMFVKSTKAQDAEDRIVYDRKTGALYYDQDGTGSKAQIKIATLAKNLALTHNDFFVV